MLEREGEGWRLAWDGQRSRFPLLIGGEGWASELTAGEGAALQKALLALRSQHSDLADTLMEEETIGLEFNLEWSVDPTEVARGPHQLPGHPAKEEGALWAELDGDRYDWTLRFVLQPTSGLRGVEGFWGKRAAAEFVKAYTELPLSAP